MPVTGVDVRPMAYTGALAARIRARGHRARTALDRATAFDEKEQWFG